MIMYLPRSCPKRKSGPVAFIVVLESHAVTLLSFGRDTYRLGFVLCNHCPLIEGLYTKDMRNPAWPGFELVNVMVMLTLFSRE